jgi:hypothetical protein
MKNVISIVIHNFKIKCYYFKRVVFATLSYEQKLKVCMMFLWPLIWLKIWTDFDRNVFYFQCTLESPYNTCLGPHCRVRLYNKRCCVQVISNVKQHKKLLRYILYKRNKRSFKKPFYPDKKKCCTLTNAFTNSLYFIYNIILYIIFFTVSRFLYIELNIFLWGRKKFIIWSHVS